MYEHEAAPSGDGVRAPRAGSSRKPRADAAENRRRLVSAAREVYREQGQAAALDAIATRAGVGNATLYRHFPNPDELRAAALSARLEEVAVFLDGLEIRRDAVAALLSYIRWIAENPDNSYSDVLLTAPGCSPLVSEQRREVRARVESLLARAAESGGLREPMTVEDLNIVIFAVSKVATDPRISAAHAERFLATVLAGLRASSPVLGGVD